MPAVSQAQRRLMFAVRANPQLGKERGIKPSIAKEFTDADQGGKLPDKVKNGKPVKQRKFGSLG